MQNAPAMSAQKMASRQSSYGGFGVVGRDMSGNKKPVIGTPQNLAFDPQISSPTVTLSNSNATVTNGTAANVLSARTTACTAQGVAGNWYWEFTPSNSFQSFVGFAEYSFACAGTNRPGVTSGVSYNPANGSVYALGSVIINTFVTCLAGDVVGLKLSVQPTSATFTVYKNGVEILSSLNVTSYIPGHTQSYTPVWSSNQAGAAGTISNNLYYYSDITTLKTPNTSAIMPTGSLGFHGGARQINIAASFAFVNVDFTVEAWVYLGTGAGTGLPIFSTGGAATGSYGFYWVGATQKFEAVRYGDLAGSGRTTGTYAPGKWYHVANTRAAGTSRVFINGVIDSGATYAMGSATTATTHNIGGGWTGFVPNGYIYNFRILYNTALYTANFTPSTRPLNAINNTQVLIKADTPTTLLKDSSIQNYTLTNTGGVAQTSFTPFDIKYSM